MIHSKQNFSSNLIDIAVNLKNLYNKICGSALITVFEKYSAINSTPAEILKFMMLGDVALSIDRAGHDSNNDIIESLPMKVIFYYLSDTSCTMENYLNNPLLMNSVKKIVTSLKETVYYTTPSPGDFNVSNTFEYNKLYIAAEVYYEIMLELNKCIVYADGEVNELENVWLKLLDSKMRYYNSLAAIQR